MIERPTDRDQMLGAVPVPPIISSQPSTSDAPPSGFVARSWARISGRRRRQKRMMIVEEEQQRRAERVATTMTMVDGQPGMWGMAAGNGQVHNEGSAQQQSWMSADRNLMANLVADQREEAERAIRPRRWIIFGLQL